MKVACRIVLLLALMVSTASAQPKRGQPRGPAGARTNSATSATPATSAAPATSVGQSHADPATSASSAPTRPSPESTPEDSADLGEPPPPRAESPSSTKLSPLTPRSDEFPADRSAPGVSIDRLLGDIAALRARVAALTTALFKSKVRVMLEVEGDESRVDALSITVDGGTVFTAPDGFSAADPRVVYEHAVAPGQHVLGVDIERYDVRRREYRTYQSSRFTIVVPDNRTLETQLVLEDDSEMAVDFPDDEDGEYELGVRLRARVVP